MEYRGADKLSDGLLGEYHPKDYSVLDVEMSQDFFYVDLPDERRIEIRRVLYKDNSISDEQNTDDNSKIIDDSDGNTEPNVEDDFCLEVLYYSAGKAQPSGGQYLELEEPYATRHSPFGIFSPRGIDFLTGRRKERLVKVIFAYQVVVVASLNSLGNWSAVVEYIDETQLMAVVCRR